MVTALGGWQMLERRPEFGFTGPRGGGQIFFATADVAQTMHYLLHQLDRRVEEVVPTSSWRAPGHDPGNVGRSNHHAATAMDQNGGRHPYEAHEIAAGRTWRLVYSKPQVRTIREILAELVNDEGKPVIRWGLDFRTGLRDPMHFEIARANGVNSLFVSNAEVAQANARVLGIVAATQRAVGARVDHKWGPKTHKRVRAVRAKARNQPLDVPVVFVQKVVGAPATGVWDARSQQALVGVVEALQRAWRVHDDGSWGGITDAAFKLQTSRFLHYKPLVAP